VKSAAEKQRASDDRFALAAVIFGGAIAFLARHDPMGLGTGLAIGLAGALLAMRGEHPIGGRAWLRAALTISLLAFFARFGLETYQEWIVSQWFAEGASGTAANRELQRMSELAAALRIVALGTGLGMLLGAAVHRMK
jgi:hypothetical protein